MNKKTLIVGVAVLSLIALAVLMVLFLGVLFWQLGVFNIQQNPNIGITESQAIAIANATKEVQAFLKLYPDAKVDVIEPDETCNPPKCDVGDYVPHKGF